MALWRDEDEMLALVRDQLYTPVVGDILDAMGYAHQFLPAAIHPLRDDMKVAGRACTVLECDVFEAQKKPFGLLTESLDQLRRNDVYVATGAHNSALWGELLTATARVRGAAGAVLDGYTRDTPQVLAQNFPVFASARWAQDSSIRTSVVDFRCTIEIGGVVIHDGDLVFGDMDGVLIVPQQAAQECIARALEKAAGEKLVRRAIEGGMSATQAFAKFGIL